MKYSQYVYVLFSDKYDGQCKDWFTAFGGCADWMKKYCCLCHTKK